VKKNILIIGGTGFIGRNIVENILETNHKLILMVRDVNKVNSLFKRGSVEIIKGRLSDVSIIEQVLIKYKIDVVIHLVSNLIPSSNTKDFNKENLDVLLPTFDLLKILSVRNIKIIFFSSGGTVYGKETNTILESNKLKPINYYGYSKQIIENQILFLNRTKKLEYLILRPSNVYGKYQKINSNQGFIAVALGKILSGSVLEVWGDGESVRDYIDVVDVSNAIIKLIESNISNKIFNLASEKGVSVNEVIHLIEKKTNKKVNIQYKDKRVVDVDRIVLSINEIKKHIEFYPKGVVEGISDFVNFIENEE